MLGDAFILITMFTLLFGILNLVIGLLGIVQNPLIGEGGLFATNGTLDTFHGLVGIFLIYAALRLVTRTEKVLKTVGILYLGLAFLGFLFGSPVLGLFETNTAMNVVHALLGVVMLMAGISHKNETTS